MSFVISKLFWSLIQPLNFIVALMVLGILLGLIGFRRIANLALWTAIGSLLAISFLPLSYIFMVPLENRFPATALPDKVDGIIMLGGAGSAELAALRHKISLNDSAERYTEVLALARRYPDARIVFTGGSAAVFGGGLSEADMAREFFKEEGLDARMTYETRSRNTWENAIFSRQIVKPAQGETWLLVTSAYHMPRSMGIFERVGWPGLIPDPVDYRTGGHVQFFGSNFLIRLQTFDVALREWIGLIAYRIMGRTDTLFPGPAS